MGLIYLSGAALVFVSLGITSAQQQSSASFTIVGGQIYTPGLAIIDAPQPFTPEGGGQRPPKLLPELHLLIFERKSGLCFT